MAGSTCSPCAFARPSLPLLQPAAPTRADVRGAVQQAVEAAQRLLPMPPFVDYSALLADIGEWVEQLQGATADVSAAQQVGAAGGRVSGRSVACALAHRLHTHPRRAHPCLAHAGCPFRCAQHSTLPPATPRPHLGCPQEASEATADASTQLASADHGDKEALHRLAWLAEQQPLVEERLAAVGGRVAPPAGAAIAALQALAQRIEGELYQSLAKPPLAEVAAERDAAVAALTTGLALPALVSGCCACGCASPPACLPALSLPCIHSCALAPSPQHPTGPSPCPLPRTRQSPASSARDVRGEVRQLVEEARQLPEMPGYVNYDPLLRDIQQWIEALRGTCADVDAARQVGVARCGMGGLRRAGKRCRTRAEHGRCNAAIRLCPADPACTAAAPASAAQAAGAATAGAATELAAADTSDREALHRLTWLRQVMEGRAGLERAGCAFQPWLGGGLRGRGAHATLRHPPPAAIPLPPPAAASSSLWWRSAWRRWAAAWRRPPAPPLPLWRPCSAAWRAASRRSWRQWRPAMPQWRPCWAAWRWRHWWVLGWRGGSWAFPSCCDCGRRLRFAYRLQACSGLAHACPGSTSPRITPPYRPWPPAPMRSRPRPAAPTCAPACSGWWSRRSGCPRCLPMCLTTRCWQTCSAGSRPWRAAPAMCPPRARWVLLATAAVACAVGWRDPQVGQRAARCCSLQPRAAGSLELGAGLLRSSPLALVPAVQEVASKAEEAAAQLAQASKEEDREGHHRLQFLRWGQQLF